MARSFYLALLIVYQGASLNLQTIAGATALHFACLNNHLECARLLCERGADTLLFVDGQTPFAVASSIHGVDSPLAAFLNTYPH